MLEPLAQQVFAQGVAGDFVEAGVYQGGLSIFMAALLHVNGQLGPRRMWLADSFRGMPPLDYSKDASERARLAADDTFAEGSLSASQTLVEWHLSRVLGDLDREASSLGAASVGRRERLRARAGLSGPPRAHRFSWGDGVARQRCSRGRFACLNRHDSDGCWCLSAPASFMDNRGRSRSSSLPGGSSRSDDHRRVDGGTPASADHARYAAAAPRMPAGVRMLPGFFNETLPGPIERIAMLRVDADTFTSIDEVLERLYPRVSPGGFVVFDDWKIPFAREAILRFRRRHNISEGLTFSAWHCRRPFRTIDPMAFWRKPR